MPKEGSLLVGANLMASLITAGLENGLALLSNVGM